MTSPALQNNNTKKRAAPLSIRFSDRERKHLEKLANGQPLSRFIKGQIFSDAPRASDAEVTERYEELARVLAALGESSVFGNLDILAKAIKAGDLELSDEQTDQIATACLFVLEMRNDLIRALGLKPPPIYEGSE